MDCGATSRSGPRSLHFIAMMSFLAAIGFSNEASAFVVGSTPHDDLIILVAAQPSPASTANVTANKTLNVLCRAANLPHTGLPEQRLPAEQTLSSTDAKSTLDAIQQLSKSQRPLCSPSPAAPTGALKVISKIGGSGNRGGGNQGGADPISHHPPLAARVAPEVSMTIRDVYRQVKSKQ